ncbi:PA0069 family radical SAM protein [Rhodoferax sp. GW822-FHT02A01]|uniref:PA0069 family radical SAM protein n=1 Tax=Rhodoferax sp. GW822-FHT02A01 TaxID=3141537 RepID=UPI00315CA3C7
MSTHPLHFVKGRGSGSNPGSRFDAFQREALAPELQHWPGDEEPDAEDAPSAKTIVVQQQARSIISRNQSPDIGFDQSINPYQGCEHGCVYCYARPTHAYLGLSPGLDFETQIFAKVNAAALLRAELCKPGYVPGLIVVGSNTDPYQPTERKLGITRSVLEVLAEAQVPVGIITKNALVTRDLDILSGMARKGLVQVNVSVTTLDHALARKLDPRASSPTSRLQAIETLASAGIPVAVFSSPMIPAINDVELEKIMQAAAEAGARYATYVLLRLPLEVRDLFVQWLQQHYPLRAEHVMHRVQQMRGGKDYDPDFATRMKGSGLFASLLAQRFQIALKRYGLQKPPTLADVSQFTPPQVPSAQSSLF